MKIIENKKLFGKINIIDIILILILVAAGIFVYFKINGDTVVASKIQSVNFQVELQKMPEGIAENIKVGDKIYDNETNVYMGEVTNVEIVPYTRIEQNKENKTFVSAEQPTDYTAIVTLKNDVVDSGNTLKSLDGYIIRVGEDVYSRGPSYAGRGYIVYIER